MDVPETQIMLLQRNENLKTWCPTSGANDRRLTPTTGWKHVRSICPQEAEDGTRAVRRWPTRTSHEK